MYNTKMELIKDRFKNNFVVNNSTEHTITISKTFLIKINGKFYQIERPDRPDIQPTLLTSINSVEDFIRNN